ncbi:MAG: (4Fe-4S)-binding protein, partial [Deltaproteobacteria bacterium]|nr:(4Fe-4S)-binding protein [Deltaproteobacteria bacterium]
GIHDLERILGVAKHFNIPATVCINKMDINLENTEKINNYCRENGVGTAGEIPYDPIVTKAMVAGKSIVEFDDGSISSKVKEVWKNVETSLRG